MLSALSALYVNGRRELLRKIKPGAGMIARTARFSRWKSFMRQRVVTPPWITYPGHDPWWGGWRQGESEGWLHHVWLPFWRQLPPEEQNAYLEWYPPPNDEWHEYLTKHWNRR
jgi:hypothetical protein